MLYLSSSRPGTLALSSALTLNRHGCTGPASTTPLLHSPSLALSEVIIVPANSHWHSQNVHCFGCIVLRGLTWGCVQHPSIQSELSAKLLVVPLCSFSVTTRTKGTSGLSYIFSKHVIVIKNTRNDN